MKLTRTRPVIFAALFTSLLAGAAATSHADDDMSKKHEQHMQQRLEEMTKELNLSETQVQQMKALHEKRKAEREAMRKAMDEILTPEQREKAQKLREERKAKRRERHAGHEQ